MPDTQPSDMQLLAFTSSRLDGSAGNLDKLQQFCSSSFRRLHSRYKVLGKASMFPKFAFSSKIHGVGKRKDLKTCQFTKAARQTLKVSAIS